RRLGGEQTAGRLVLQRLQRPESDARRRDRGAGRLRQVQLDPRAQGLEPDLLPVRPRRGWAEGVEGSLRDKAVTRKTVTRGGVTRKTVTRQRRSRTRSGLAFDHPALSLPRHAVTFVSAPRL